MVFSWEIPHSTGTIQWVFNISRARQAVNEAELATQQVLGEVEARFNRRMEETCFGCGIFNGGYISQKLVDYSTTKIWMIIPQPSKSS